MATRKANTDPEEIEVAVPNQDVEKVLANQEEQIRKLQAELAAAQRRSSGRQDDAAVVRQAAMESAEAGKDPFDVIVTVRVPRRPKGEDSWYWLNVNGRSCQVPADDQYHEMRLPWAETLVNMLGAERMAENFEDGLPNWDPKKNPKPE